MDVDSVRLLRVVVRAVFFCERIADDTKANYCASEIFRKSSEFCLHFGCSFRAKMNDQNVNKTHCLSEKSRMHKRFALVSSAIRPKKRREP